MRARNSTEIKRIIIIIIIDSGEQFVHLILNSQLPDRHMKIEPTSYLK